MLVVSVSKTERTECRNQWIFVPIILEHFLLWGHWPLPGMFLQKSICCLLQMYIRLIQICTERLLVHFWLFLYSPFKKKLIQDQMVVHWYFYILAASQLNLRRLKELWLNSNNFTEMKFDSACVKSFEMRVIFLIITFHHGDCWILKSIMTLILLIYSVC